MQELQRSPTGHPERERKSSSTRKISDEEIVEYRKRKALRKAAKSAKKLKAELYSNESNPFSDPNFNEKFVWKKKIEGDVSDGIPLEIFSAKAEKKRELERTI